MSELTKRFQSIVEGKTFRKQKNSDPNSVMFNAQALQKFVDSIEIGNDPISDPHIFKGQFIAVPVLLALSMEMALKAWWAREIKDNAVPKTHDLLELFDGLPEQTRIRLENSHPALPNPDHPQLQPLRQGLRSLLASNREKFVEWRYPYEILHSSFPIGEFKAALSSVIDEFLK